jgi:phage terminase small subunit
MSRRRTNPETGEPQLTYRERVFINEYINNGGNGKQAAIAAGYGSGRPDQSAYQVLHRLQVQQHIQDRISEAAVCADEVIGTLASFMRGNIADLLDDDGNFDIALVKRRQLGHLLKTVTRTTRKIKTELGQPLQIAQDYRIQLHSPVQAASILARLMGIHRKISDPQYGDIAAPEAPPFDDSASSYNPFNSLSVDETVAHHHGTSEPLSSDCFPACSLHDPHQAPAPGGTPDDLSPIINEFLDPTLWMEGLIKHEMQRTGASRSEVIETLLQLRPDAAEFIRPDPTTQDGSFAASSETISATNLSVQASDHSNPLENANSVENAKTVESDEAVHNTNALTPEPSPPPGSTQTSPLQQVKLSHRSAKNLRKINPTQCLERDATQPPQPSAKPRGERRSQCSIKNGRRKPLKRLRARRRAFPPPGLWTTVTRAHWPLAS